MRLLVVGNSGEIDGLVEAAHADGMAVERRRDEPPAGGGVGEIAAISAQLRELEAALTGAERPDAVLVASHSSAALAAVIVATKVGTPVGWVAAPGADPDGTNARLIRQLADRELAAEPAAILNWMRDTYTQRA